MCEIETRTLRTLERLARPIVRPLLLAQQVRLVALSRSDSTGGVDRDTLVAEHADVSVLEEERLFGCCRGARAEYERRSGEEGTVLGLKAAGVGGSGRDGGLGQGERKENRKCGELCKHRSRWHS